MLISTKDRKLTQKQPYITQPIDRKSISHKDQSAYTAAVQEMAPLMEFIEGP